MSPEARHADTPYGPNAIYTVRFHVTAVVVDELGSARPTDEFFERRVVTPFGELKAIAIAAGVLATENPELDFDEVEITKVEHEFDSIWSADLRDRKAIAR